MSLRRTIKHVSRNALQHQTKVVQPWHYIAKEFMRKIHKKRIYTSILDLFHNDEVFHASQLQHNWTQEWCIYLDYMRTFHRRQTFFHNSTVPDCRLCHDEATQAQAQHRVGALTPMPSCLGIGRHTGGSWQGHPRCNTSAPTVGRLWVARPHCTVTQHKDASPRWYPRIASVQSLFRTKPLQDNWNDTLRAIIYGTIRNNWREDP